jgi:hypothetical protein
VLFCRIVFCGALLASQTSRSRHSRARRTTTPCRSRSRVASRADYPSARTTRGRRHWISVTRLPPVWQTSLRCIPTTMVWQASIVITLSRSTGYGTCRRLVVCGITLSCAHSLMTGNSRASRPLSVARQQASASTRVASTLRGAPMGRACCSRGIRYWLTGTARSPGISTPAWSRNRR